MTNETKFDWTDRLNRATAHRKFIHADVIAAFNRDQNLVAEFGIPTDEFGQPWDGFLQRLNDKFGWCVLSDDVNGALVAFQAVAERIDAEHGRRAA